jgi:hypothetical protein
MKRRLYAVILTLIWLCGVPIGHTHEIFCQTASDISKRLHVYCECHNTWINGDIENYASVELRSGTSFGPVLLDATIEVNEQKLIYDEETQTYRGDIGKVKQWQEIPIRIQTRDNRKMKGHVVAVFMVQFKEPQAGAIVPSTGAFPVSWKYSEGSMHTVDLEIFSNNKEPVGMEVRGNHTTVDLGKLGIGINRSENLHLRVLPPWTSNFEFSGNLTRRSKAHFITSATLAVRVADR